MASASPASAQGLLDAIGRVLGIVPPPPAMTDAPPPPGSPGYLPGGTESRPAEGGSQVAFCVRTCDGRYFPISKNDAASPAKICQSMCPTAATEIYYGSTIETAYSQKGTGYTSLANAFVYRDRMVEGCSCNARSETGTTTISYRNDPTLRPGDIVMTETGAVVFKGAVGTAHGDGDFVPVQKSNRISGTLRDKVIALKVMPTRQAQAHKPKHPANVAEAAKTERAPESPQALGFND